MRDYGRPRPSEEPDSDRCRQPAADREILLRGHQGCEYEHPAEVAHADHEHHQHQCPAAAHAEQPVIEADPQGLARGRDSPPASIDKTEGSATAVQAAVLERAELEGSCTREYERADNPTMDRQPPRAGDDTVDGRIGGMGD